jgi:hypothetical protein
MRFAWQREKSGNQVKIIESGVNRLILFIYNAVWWVPIILGFTKVIDYQTAFISFFIITLIRAVSNIYRNNALTQEQAEVFPLRSP